ncbi:hypothetical protein Ciccas_013312 [Cichlidogyrus casuarinus]|uniref:Uncharacterized protein n=1 Tax=Cichlidogyrus casuarinus TaxID=1844966 RepID=A0ABD2PKY0_9PLAT
MTVVVQAVIAKTVIVKQVMKKPKVRQIKITVVRKEVIVKLEQVEQTVLTEEVEEQLDKVDKTVIALLKAKNPVTLGKDCENALMLETHLTYFIETSPLILCTST